MSVHIFFSINISLTTTFGYSLSHTYILKKKIGDIIYETAMTNSCLEMWLSYLRLIYMTIIYKYQVNLNTFLIIFCQIIQKFQCLTCMQSSKLVLIGSEVRFSKSTNILIGSEVETYSPPFEAKKHIYNKYSVAMLALGSVICRHDSVLQSFLFHRDVNDA